MKNFKLLIIGLNLVLLLFYFNHSVVEKEKLLKDGQLVLLELAPVDPRSLMQGDYMALRYKIAGSIDTDSIAKRGYCVIKLDSNGVANKLRFQTALKPLNEGEYILSYRSSGYQAISFGAEAFFFQEGQAEKYGRAKYGAIKIDGKGNSLLIGLYDKLLRRIE